MDAKLILIIAGVGVACFVLGLLVRGRRRDDGRMIVQRAPFTPQAGQTGETHSTAQIIAPAAQTGGTQSSYGGANVGIDLQLGRDVEGLLSAGKKIQAVVLVRERTGMGLKESKDVVDRLEGLMKRLGS